MIKIQSIIVTALVILMLSILLKIIGIINITFTEIMGYALIFYGIADVYSSMGKNKKTLLFIGAVAFLVGVELLITSNYDFFKLSNIVLPSIFFILGTAFLVLFIDDLKNRLLLAISIIFLISGVYFFGRLGIFNSADFFRSLFSISRKYWPIIVIVTAIILLIKK